MVSLNDLDQQIGALESAEEEEAEEDEVVEEKRSKGSREPKSKLEAEETKRKKGRAARNAVCFRYLEGTCKFDDCKFGHVNPQKLTSEERAQVLQELPLRKYSKKLSEAIRALNIPRCKDFHQRGGCKRPTGKCHFWHLTDATVAKWAGFDFWCAVCSKGFTSEDQMLEHKASKVHQRLSWKSSGVQHQYRCGSNGDR
ncbi:unnamed protein product [Effrenium voratum]|uniref:Uncharacterized protein n=1 Tax=Effrenium voratum TaxID=2562239 RepID=A0AA36JC34_9DINO|nr:unnamed protein product [Effrenium voratum]